MRAVSPKQRLLPEHLKLKANSGRAAYGLGNIYPIKTLGGSGGSLPQCCTVEPVDVDAWLH